VIYECWGLSIATMRVRRSNWYGRGVVLSIIRDIAGTRCPGMLLVSLRTSFYLLVISYDAECDAI
jgi:hypothetical protein